MRVPAVRADAVHLPRPELAAFVHLMADRTHDGELRKILPARHLAHAPSPARRHLDPGQQQRLRQLAQVPGIRPWPTTRRPGALAYRPGDGSDDSEYSKKAESNSPIRRECAACPGVVIRADSYHVCRGGAQFI